MDAPGIRSARVLPLRAFVSCRPRCRRLAGPAGPAPHVSRKLVVAYDVDCPGDSEAGDDEYKTTPSAHVSDEGTQPVHPRSVGRTIRAYVTLTKPRVLELLLVTTVPVMILAAGAFPRPASGARNRHRGALSAASAASFNMYLDRDMDAHMKRAPRIGRS